MVVFGSTWVALEVSARAGKSGKLAPLVRTLGENVGLSGRKTAGGMARQSVGADSWASSMFCITLVMGLGAVGALIGPRLQHFPDGQPLIQGKLAARNGHALAFTHFTPDRCVHHWGIVRGTGIAVLEGPNFLWPSRRRRH